MGIRAARIRKEVDSQPHRPAVSYRLGLRGAAVQRFQYRCPEPPCNRYQCPVAAEQEPEATSHLARQHRPSGRVNRRSVRMSKPPQWIEKSFFVIGRVITAIALVIFILITIDLTINIGWNSTWEDLFVVSGISLLSLALLFVGRLYFNFIDRITR